MLITVYKPVKYITREYTTGGWVDVEWTEYCPFLIDDEEYYKEMYIHIETPKIKCSKCGSTNIARTINNPPMSLGRLICLDCGHRGEEEYIYPRTESDGNNSWSYEPIEKTF